MNIPDRAPDAVSIDGYDPATGRVRITETYLFSGPTMSIGDASSGPPQLVNYGITGDTPLTPEWFATPVEDRQMHIDDFRPEAR